VKFKDILAWCKSHILIVVSVLLILVILPVAAFFSTSWHKSILTEVQKKADAEMAKTKVSVTYALPQVDPSVPAITQSGSPNPKATEFFSKTREQMLAEVEQLAKKGEDFNRGIGPQAQGVGRAQFMPIIDGLFPKPLLTPEQQKQDGAAREVEQLKLNDLEDRLLGKGNKQTPYVALLAGMRAGLPPDEERVAEILRDLNQREREKITAGNRQMTPEETERLRQLLKDRRLGEYQAVARSISVYANMDVFATSAASAATSSVDVVSFLPQGAIPPVMLNRARAFLFQWDLWTLQDLFNAVRLANTDASGKPTGVDQSVVKRIRRLEIYQPDGMKKIAAENASARDETSAQTGEPPVEAAIPSPPIDRSKSLVGWIRAGGNSVYEVRKVKMVAIVSSARINQFIDALQRSNFIAVTDLDLARVDTWEQLREGYFYGDEHVVEATFVIESAWLTSWLLPMMPSELQLSLGRTPAPEAEATGTEEKPANGPT